MSATQHETGISEDTDHCLFDGEYSALFAQVMSEGGSRTLFLQAVLSKELGNKRDGLLPVIEQKDVKKSDVEPRSDRPLTRLEVMGVKLDLAQEWTDASSVVALRKVVRSESGSIISDDAVLCVQPPHSE